MTGKKNDLIVNYSKDAEATDILELEFKEHVSTLSIGMIGELGDILTEIKKSKRERASLSGLTERLVEEFGDFMWYFIRLVTMVDSDLISRLPSSFVGSIEKSETDLRLFMDFGSEVGLLVSKVNDCIWGETCNPTESMLSVWAKFLEIANKENICLERLIEHNNEKRKNRWLNDYRKKKPYDDNFPEEEQLPRHIKIDFIEKEKEGKTIVLLRSRGINIGDRLTDNIPQPDDYRFHDIFHLGYMAYLGWSPVIRSMMNCKRKSDKYVDENQDGARAMIIEEAISAIVFSRAKELDFFEGLNYMEYNLLKTIKTLVKGYEIEDAPLKLWEEAILESYNVFRRMVKFGGGRVTIDMENRSLQYEAP